MNCKYYLCGAIFLWMVKILNFKNFGLKASHFTRFFCVFNLIFLVAFVSCNEDKQVPEEIAKIPVNLKLERFDREFASADSTDLPQLIKKYPYLFPERYDTSFWEKKLNDTLQIELNKEVEQKFPDFKEEMDELDLLYKHIKYYFPKTTLPTVVTITSDVDYHNKVILADSLLIVALDTYLGSDHRFYKGIQQFYSQNFNKEQIAVDVASAFAEKIVKRPAKRRFLDEIIYQGKRLYIMQELLSLKAKNKIISYTPDQLEWAQDNEVNIWTYFVERQLLFETDSKLLERFVNPAPFSKFYLEFDNDSPPRLGRYIGWQIVSSYMKNNNVPLQMLSGKTTDEIFENAKYKPSK